MRYWKRKKIPADTCVSMVIAAFVNYEPRQLEALLSLLHCFKAQTWDNWQAIVVHDGPLRKEANHELIEATRDCRIAVLEPPERKKQFGHPYRTLGIQHAQGQYIGLTNQDNWYAPVYFEAMLDRLVNHGADFVHCDMIHSHQHWRPFETAPRKSRIDVGGWIARADLVKSTPWKDYSFSSDGVFIEAVVAKCKKVEHLKHYYFVHN